MRATQRTLKYHRHVHHSSIRIRGEAVRKVSISFGLSSTGVVARQVDWFRSLADSGPDLLFSRAIGG
jgi:hypothetical protein